MYRQDMTSSYGDWIAAGGLAQTPPSVKMPAVAELTFDYPGHLIRSPWPCQEVSTKSPEFSSMFEMNKKANFPRK